MKQLKTASKAAIDIALRNTTDTQSGKLLTNSHAKIDRYRIIQVLNSTTPIPVYFSQKIGTSIKSRGFSIRLFLENINPQEKASVSVIFKSVGRTASMIRSLVLAIALIVALFTQAEAGIVKTSTWFAAHGGNDHTYSLWIPDSSAQSHTWQSSRNQADALSLNGVSGHLASVTSAAENDFLQTEFSGFLFDNGIVGQQAPSNSIYAWIGLFAPTVNSQFQWTTGEPLAYMNWAPDEPNFQGFAFWQYTHYWTRDFGNGPTWTWNNEQNAGFEVLNNSNRYGFIVEFATIPEPNCLALSSIGIFYLLIRRKK